MEKKKVKCSDCDKYFRDRYNSWRHYLRAHVPSKEKRSEPKPVKPKPVCSHCGHVFYKNGNLKRHSNLCKKIKFRSLNCEEFSFNDMCAFEEWKHKIEAETNARFVRKSYYKLQNGSYRSKFSCHRSGFFKSQGNNVRRLKSLGSNKINAICPAKIIAIANSEGKVDVSFFPKHNGHSMELERISLTKTERAKIAEKIANKIPFREILNSLKNSSDSDFKRLHLLTKKDLRNIKKEFNISNTASYSCDINCLLSDIPEVESNNAEPLEFISKTTALELISVPEEANDALDSAAVGILNSPEITHSPGIQQNSAAEVHKPTFIVQVPYGVDISQQNFNGIESNSKGTIDSIKEEMRREFEMVLSSIQNEEQALNGKKWVYAFHSFVHSTHFPLPLDSGV